VLFRCFVLLIITGKIHNTWHLCSATVHCCATKAEEVVLMKLIHNMLTSMLDSAQQFQFELCNCHLINFIIIMWKSYVLTIVTVCLVRLQ
jgi:hypothetical protein